MWTISDAPLPMAQAPASTGSGSSSGGPSVPPARFAVFDGDLDSTWLELYGTARALAIDTEAMGLIHGRDRLCLVQVKVQQRAAPVFILHAEDAVALSMQSAAGNQFTDSLTGPKVRVQLQ